MRTPLLALVEIADDLAGELLREVTVECNPAAEEPHDVDAAERGDGVLE
jgi:hypothetical protein